MKKTKTQADAVVEALTSNGGYAKLNYLYRNVPKIPGVEWKTLTPNASIRRIVQEDKRILKIKPGLYALKEYIKNLPIDIFMLIENNRISNDNSEATIYSHNYYQGLIAEIGMINKFNTYIPPQDRGKKYIDKKLDDFSLMKDLPRFTYEELVNSVKNIDVIWFNTRNFPQKVYEVEHTTDFDNSLLKFLKLRDFNVKMNIVADRRRKGQFEKRIKHSAFDEIRNRVLFIDYDKLGKIYEACVALNENDVYSFIN